MDKMTGKSDTMNAYWFIVLITSANDIFVARKNFNLSNFSIVVLNTYSKYSRDG